ncbi:P-loop containing nucleoside triphosphate hydrolase protein [Boletus coccyginus]|nr:P-loop containing nucleoside triphosphate hydrolase protein [Boletus coccyginus]
MDGSVFPFLVCYLPDLQLSIRNLESLVLHSMAEVLQPIKAGVAKYFGERHGNPRRPGNPGMLPKQVQDPKGTRRITAIRGGLQMRLMVMTRANRWRKGEEYPREMCDTESKELPGIRRPLAIPTGILPSFPSPTAPRAPPKSVLAMQGVDKALIRAEVINPNAVTPLSTAEHDPYDSGLSSKTRRRLLDLGISELFAVQTTLLPFLIRHSRSLYTPYSVPHDVCVSAPTGSGKTLAYVLPILELLSTRIVTRLRALIVLPTRDLVTQVRETFEAVGKGHGLKFGTATGQHSFAHEQAQLVSETDSGLLGGSSKVDVLICTPGRLIDHLNGTPNFSLQHLRFLVIDEADRLLSQSFQDWLAQVLIAIHWRRESISPVSSQNTCFPPYCDSLAPACLDHERRGCQPDVGEQRSFSCQKLLFSATLTRDPGKLASLGLRDPKYFVVQSQTKYESDGAPSHLISERFAMPTTLTEYMIICEPSQKPLMLLHLLHNHNIRNALIFTKSSESTTRLVFLLECFEELRTTERARVTVRAYSSDLPVGERKTVLEKFKAQEVHVLVCSDLISRGIDINLVSHVVSYDTPIDMRKYVHRVGRTARAGRGGDAWTLVEEQEARYFKAMLKEHDHLQKVKRIKVPQSETQPFLETYQAALHRLGDVYSR